METFRVCGYVSLLEECVASFPVFCCCYRYLQYTLSILLWYEDWEWAQDMQYLYLFNRTTLSRLSLLCVDAGKVQWSEGFFLEDAEVCLRVRQLLSLHRQFLDSKATQPPSFRCQSRQRENQKCITKTQLVLKFESVHCLHSYISYQCLLCTFVFTCTYLGRLHHVLGSMLYKTSLMEPGVPCWLYETTTRQSERSIQFRLLWLGIKCSYIFRPHPLT